MLFTYPDTDFFKDIAIVEDRQPSYFFIPDFSYWLYLGRLNLNIAVHSEYSVGGGLQNRLS